MYERKHDEYVYSLFVKSLLKCYLASSKEEFKPLSNLTKILENFKSTVKISQTKWLIILV